MAPHKIYHIIKDTVLQKKLSDIRVTYSGLISFAVAMGSILSGTIFTIIVTRQLDVEEFGIWAIIGGMIGYSIATEPIISYWTTRQIARDEPVGKTSLVSSSFFAGFSIPIYVVSVYLFSGIEPEFFNSMILAVILIPVNIVSHILSSINKGHKPHAVSIGKVAFESLKIPAGLGLVFFLGLGLDGAITAIFIASLANIAIQIRYAKPRLLVKLNFLYLKNWLKQSWIPLYARISGVLTSLDVIIFTVITGSIIGVAYYAAAFVVARMVTRSGLISLALYPKLLANGSHKYISENFARMMYFAIPLVIIAIIFSKHALFVLNPEYVHVGTAVMFLSLGAFFTVIITFFYQILMGIETVDVKQNPSLSKLLRSNLFLISTLSNIRYALYIVILAVVLYLFQGLSDIELVIIWSIIPFVLSIPFLIHAILLTRRHVAFTFPYISILKYLIGGAGIAVVFTLTNEHVIVFETSIYSYMPRFILELVFCGIAYLGITYIIDHKTRKLFRLILSEILFMLRRS